MRGWSTQLRKLYPDISFPSLERVCSNVPKENLAHTFYPFLRPTSLSENKEVEFHFLCPNDSSTTYWQSLGRLPDHYKIS